MAVLGGTALFCILYFRFSPPAVLLFVILLLIPGRLSGFFWRDFYRGRKLLSMREWEKSLGYFERFLADLKKRPWLKHLIWLNWGIYTRSVEVMTHNNMGVAQLNLGKLAEAEQHFCLAGEIDNEAPLPCYNLALLAQIKGDTEKAGSLLKKSQELGYTGTTYDRLIQAAGAALAQVEGH